MQFNKMKIFLFIYLITQLAFSQSIEAKLGGDTDSETFEVIDSNDNTLFQVQGDGKVNITQELHIGYNSSAFYDYLKFGDGSVYLRWDDNNKRFSLSGYISFSDGLMMSGDAMSWNDFKIGIGDLHVGSNDGGSLDIDKIFFGNGPQQYLQWRNENSRFEFSTDLYINGNVDINGAIYQRGSSLHADYVFEDDYELESIQEHSDYMLTNKHLPGIPKAQVDENGREIVEVGAHRKGIVEELEKAHIYISELEKRIKKLEELLIN